MSDTSTSGQPKGKVIQLGQAGQAPLATQASLGPSSPFGKGGPIIDLATSAAERRKTRVAELTALLQLEPADAVMIVVEREGDPVPAQPEAGRAIVYKQEGEIQVRRILARLGFGSTLPLTWGGLRGLLKYGKALVSRVTAKAEPYPTPADLLEVAESKLMQAGDIEGLAKSHAATGRTFETLSEDFEINGDLNWGGATENHMKFWKVQHGRLQVILPWWQTLRTYGASYSAPYVSGKHPLLLLPEFAPLRGLPLNVGFDKLNLGQLLSGSPAVDKVRGMVNLNSKLCKFGMYYGEIEVLPYGRADVAANREKVGYVTVDLCELLPALEPQFKKLKVKPEGWFNSVLPFAWHVEVGSEPHLIGIVHAMRQSRVAFTVPAARKRGGGVI
jgi:hypothetical protein